MDLDELYQEIIIDHAKHPRCKGRLSQASSNTTLLNPLCGDEIELQVSVQDGRILDIAFSGHGCAISQASSSMMSELCKGKTVAEARGLMNTFVDMMKSEKSSEEIEVLGDAKCLEGVRRFSARIKCATLGWEALQQCLTKIPEL
jgi:nitrogen fixation NifU-like protein